MAKKQNSFEKRRRDMEKKLRADDKRKKRQMKKERANEPRSDGRPLTDGMSTVT